ncbi:MAG: glycosyltransferase, partial [Promethearchaeota archaeon]
MKIAVVTDHVPSTFAHSFNTMKMANALYKLGYQVEILTILRFLEFKYLLKIKNLHYFYEIDKNIPINFFVDKSLDFFREAKIIRRFTYIISIILKKLLPRINEILDPEKRISYYCKQKKFDLVYCRRTNKVLFYNLLLKIPTILEDHNFNISSTLKKILKLNSRYFLGLITLNEILKKKYEETSIPRNKIIICEDAVDLRKFSSINLDKQKIREKLRLANNVKIILYVGNLYLYRGIDTIINCSKYLSDLNLKFYIIGGTRSQIKYWKSLSKNNKKIIFLGFKDHSLVPFYLKSADILLAPYSKKCKTSRWMSPMKLFEYMAAEVPIIASDLKRIKDICGKNGCLTFNSDDPKDLSKKIRLLLSQEDLQQQLIKNSFKKVQKYTYIIRATKILESIKKNKIKMKEWNLDSIINILACPYCGATLSKIQNGLKCTECNQIYYINKQNQIDLRLKKPKKYVLPIILNSNQSVKQNSHFKILKRKPNPELNLSKIKIPHHLTEELISHFPRAKTEKEYVLDLGCGNMIHKEICEMAGFKYIGMDYQSPKAQILGDAHALPYKDNSFSFIISIAVLEHIRYPLIMMKEVYRVLKPNSLFIGTV